MLVLDSGFVKNLPQLMRILHMNMFKDRGRLNGESFREHYHKRNFQNDLFSPYLKK